MNAGHHLTNDVTSVANVHLGDGRWSAPIGAMTTASDQRPPGHPDDLTNIEET